MNIRYLRAKSLTWWSGMLMITLGVMQAAGWPASWNPDTEGLTGVLAAVARALIALTGPDVSPSSPATLITLGMGLIGYRDKMEREAVIAERRHEEMMYFVESEMQTIGQAREDRAYDEGDDYELPPGESPLPPGCVDPWAEGGSRG